MPGEYQGLGPTAEGFAASCDGVYEVINIKSHH